MMQGRYVGLGLLALAGLAVYGWPVPRKDFAQLSARVDPQVRQSLLDFRIRHPVRSVQVDGQAWDYVVLGEETESVLFLHGMTGAYDIWWQQMEALASTCRVISVTYPPVDSLAGMSRGVWAVLDAEDVDEVHVVGSSLGGYLTQYLLSTCPERIRSAVLGNTFPPNDVYRAKNETQIRLLPWLPAWLIMHAFRKNIESSIYPASGYSELVRAYLLEQTYGRMSKAQVVARARAVLDDFEPANAAALGIPILIIEADNDPLVPPVLRNLLRETYPSARVTTLQQVGHFPYLNEPVTYTQLVRSHILGEDSRYHA